MSSIIKLSNYMIKNTISIKNGFQWKRFLTFSSIHNKTRLSYAFTKTDGLNLIGKTINDCLNDRVLEQPNQIAYKFCLTQESFTYLELRQQIDEIAQNLLKIGFKKGDRLSVILPNVPELALISLACASIGVIVVLMNPAYQLIEIEYMLKKTKSKGLVILDNLKTLRHYEILTKICPELSDSPKGQINSKNLPDLKHVILVKNNLVKDSSQKYNGVWFFDQDIKLFNREKQEVPHIDIDDTFALIFTSGTTGLPKAAPISNHTVLNSAYLENNYSGCFDSNKNVCIPIPLFHVFGLAIGMISSIVNANKMIFPYLLPDTLHTLKAIQNEKCTSLKGAPIIFIDLLNHPERKNFNLSSLESMLIGASTVPKDLLLKIKKELNLKHIIIGYGISETGSVGSLTRTSDVQCEKYAYESIGQGFPFVEAKIIDTKTKKIVPINNDGELCLRGYNIMQGYWDEPQKTAEAICDNGWYHSGDICSMDENGYLYFKSRAKEMVIRGGVNIYPAEVERFIRTHNSVLDCYVIGVPDKRLGEELCAWIKLKPDTCLTAEEINSFCDGNIAYYKIPKYFKFVDSFPMNATGKVQKFKMVEIMKSELKIN